MRGQHRELVFGSGEASLPSNVATRKRPGTLQTLLGPRPLQMFFLDSYRGKQPPS
jgi:hypothetical protein